MNKSEFQVGPYRIIAEISEVRIKENSPEAPQEQSADLTIKRHFLSLNKSAIQTRPGNIAYILQNGSPVFYLEAHGEDSGGKWCYFDGENDENPHPVEEKLEQIAAEGVKGAFIFSCNPHTHPIKSTKIPVIYSAFSLGMPNMREVLVFKKPEEMYLTNDQKLGIVLPYIDALYDLEKELIGEYAASLFEKKNRTYERMRNCAKELLSSQGNAGENDHAAHLRLLMDMLSQKDDDEDDDGVRK
jgi:hypothetical protein